jgi:hypothetical protein
MWQYGLEKKIDIKNLISIYISAAVQVTQYDEQFIQLFTLAMAQLKQVCYSLM